MQEAREDVPEATRDQLRLFAKLLEKYMTQAGHASYNGMPPPHSHEDDSSGGSLDEGAELLAWLAWQRSGC